MIRFLTALVTASFLAATISAQDESRRPRFDVSFFGGAYDLEEIEFDPKDTFFTDEMDFEVERDRVGARFAIGNEAVRGFFQLLAEEWTVDDLDGSGFEEFDNFGVGGGVRGTPRVDDGTSAVGIVVPYQANFSALAGFEEVMDEDVALFYVEFHGEVGLGLDWHGLRPAGGLLLNALGGTVTADEDFDGDDEDDRVDLWGLNVGAYGELAYKHPDFPLYFRARASGGDYETLEFAIGANW